MTFDRGTVIVPGSFLQASHPFSKFEPNSGKWRNADVESKLVHFVTSVSVSESSSDF